MKPYVITIRTDLPDNKSTVFAGTVEFAEKKGACDGLLPYRSRRAVRRKSRLGQEEPVSSISGKDRYWAGKPGTHGAAEDTIRA